MSTNIFNYDGSLLTTIQDGAVSTGNTSLQFPGRGYKNYGSAINANLLWLMQNFANASAPLQPVVGQLWYDTSAVLLKVYSASGWVAAGGVINSTTQPVAPNQGSFWYDTGNKQLNVWNGTAWTIIGPLGSASNNDPTNPTIPANSQIDSAILLDSSNAQHQVWRISIGGGSPNLFAILSKDSFAPNPAIAGFSTIYPGINLNSNISNISVSGDTTVFRSTKDNLPDQNNVRNMGSASYKFSNMYSVNFVGTASSALYADLAERYESDEHLDPGTVVILGGQKEVMAARVYGDDGVFGVVSTNPAFKMNSDVGTDDTHPYIALIGRTPCKISGKISKGQRIMASNEKGVACAWDDSTGTLSIIGRSLETKLTDDVSLVEVVLGKN